MNAYITNEMVKGAPRMSEVISRIDSLLDGKPTLAHNASFDRKFLQSERRHHGARGTDNFFCSLRLARCVFPGLSSYRLGELAARLRLASDFVGHRAMADAQMTFRLLQAMEQELIRRYELRSLPIEWLLELQDIPHQKVEAFFRDKTKRPPGDSDTLSVKNGAPIQEERDVVPRAKNVYGQTRQRIKFSFSGGPVWVLVDDQTLVDLSNKRRFRRHQFYFDSGGLVRGFVTRDPQVPFIHESAVHRIST